MNTQVAEFFAFSPRQLRFVVFLACLAVVLAVILLVQTLSRPPREPLNLPVVLADADRTYTGVFVLDPNLAPADSLELLPGIGRVLADRIVAYRQHHRFERPVDITEVKGIGPKVFEQIRPYLRVGQL